MESHHGDEECTTLVTKNLYITKNFSCSLLCNPKDAIVYFEYTYQPVVFSAALGDINVDTYTLSEQRCSIA